MVSRSDPSEHALEAFAQVVRNLELGRRGDSRSSSPTPTSRSPTSAAPATARPATGTPAPGSTSPTSARARPTRRYLRYAWPGTAILIDDDEPQPRLLEMLADLNPLDGGPGLPEPR